MLTQPVSWVVYLSAQPPLEGFGATRARARYMHGVSCVSDTGKAGTVSEASVALFGYCRAVAEQFAMSWFADNLGLRVFPPPVDTQVQ